MGRTNVGRSMSEYWTQELTHLAASARTLPPTWQHGDAWPILYGDVTLGVVWPGLGVQLDVPLRSLGISRTIPHVIERSLWDRCLDTLGDPRMAAGLAAACVGAAVLSDAPLSAPLFAGTLTTFNSIVSAIGAGRSDVVLCSYDPLLIAFNSAAGQWAFPYALFRPGAFTFSSGLSATAPGYATAGALNGYAQAPSSGQTQILQAVHELNRTAVNISRPAMFLFVDVLYECGGIVMSTTNTQTLGTAAITRYTNGIGVFMLAIGTVVSNDTTASATVTYTNSEGTGSHSATVAHNGNAGQGQYIAKPPFRAWPFVDMQAGDVGVRSIESVAWSNATGTGEMAMMLVKPVGTVYAKQREDIVNTDFMQRGYPIPLGENACLTMLPRLNNPAGQFREYDSTFALRFTSV